MDRREVLELRRWWRLAGHWTPAVLSQRLWAERAALDILIANPIAVSYLATTGHWRASLGLYLTFVALALLWVATGAWLFTSSIEHGPRFAGERLTGPGNAPALPLQ